MIVNTFEFDEFKDSYKLHYYNIHEIIDGEQKVSNIMDIPIVRLYIEKGIKLELSNDLYQQITKLKNRELNFATSTDISLIIDEIDLNLINIDDDKKSQLYINSINDKVQNILNHYKNHLYYNLKSLTLKEFDREYPTGNFLYYLVKNYNNLIVLKNYIQKFIKYGQVKSISKILKEINVDLSENNLNLNPFEFLFLEKYQNHSEKFVEILKETKKVLINDFNIWLKPKEAAKVYAEEMVFVGVFKPNLGERLIYEGFCPKFNLKKSFMKNTPAIKANGMRGELRKLILRVKKEIDDLDE